MFVKAKDIFKGEWKEKRIIFCIVEDDIQEKAKQILGRELTEEELRKASKGVEEGLSYGLGTVLETSIREAINNRRCCATCKNFNPDTFTCEEGGFSEIGDPFKEMTTEDCNAYEPLVDIPKKSHEL